MTSSSSAKSLEFEFDDPAGINNVDVNAKANANAIYNIQGMQVDGNYKGIVIKDGKKFLNK